MTSSAREIFSSIPLPPVYSLKMVHLTSINFIIVSKGDNPMTILLSFLVVNLSHENKSLRMRICPKLCADSSVSIHIIASSNLLDDCFTTAYGAYKFEKNIF